MLLIRYLFYDIVLIIIKLFLIIVLLLVLLMFIVSIIFLLNMMANYDLRWWLLLIIWMLMMALLLPLFCLRFLFLLKFWCWLVQYNHLTLVFLFLLEIFRLLLLRLWLLYSYWPFGFPIFYLLDFLLPLFSWRWWLRFWRILWLWRRWKLILWVHFVVFFILCWLHNLLMFDSLFWGVTFT